MRDESLPKNGEFAVSMCIEGNLDRKPSKWPKATDPIASSIDIEIIANIAIDPSEFASLYKAGFDPEDLRREVGNAIVKVMKKAHKAAETKEARERMRKERDGKAL